MTNTPPHTPPPPADDSEEKGLITPKERSILRRMMVFILKTVAIVLVLFMVLAFVVQITSVQNWIIDKTTAYLSKELKTKMIVTIPKKQKRLRAAKEYKKRIMLLGKKKKV